MNEIQNDGNHCISVRTLGAQATYGAGDNGIGAQPEYGAGGAGDDPFGVGGGSGDPNIAMLEKAVPGIPGEDYPIYGEVPDTAFSCDGQVDGGENEERRLGVGNNKPHRRGSTFAPSSEI